ncbi:MAG: VOC family protein [Candidatus Rokuibacteriota bacterium]
MISGGTASVYVTDMDRAVAFWTDAVGLKLRTRVGTTWAEIDAGEGLIIGLHRAAPPDTAAAGTPGAINIELRVTEPLEEVIAALSARGVTIDGPIKEYEAVRIASFSDPDGNAIVLGQVLHS